MQQGISADIRGDINGYPQWIPHIPREWHHGQALTIRSATGGLLVRGKLRIHYFEAPRRRSRATIEGPIVTMTMGCHSLRTPILERDLILVTSEYLLLLLCLRSLLYRFGSDP